jgi:A118 family predicted phage portal protein
MDIIRKLKEKGYDTVPADFYSKITEWKSWYDGNVKHFHEYHVFNGLEHVKMRRYSLGMAKKVAEDWADLLLNEKCAITLEGEAEQAAIDAIFEANNFEVKANEMQEMKSALGTVAYVARVDNATINTDTGELVTAEGTTIKLDYVTAPNIFPLSWENGMVRECAFACEKVIDKETYTYLQIHRLENGRYCIDNSIYRTTNGGCTEVELSSVRGFENVQPTIYTVSDKPQFVIDRLNIANNVDNTLPMGIPAFANAIDQLKAVDVAYDSYVNEFVLGKKRIMVKPEATKDLDGNPVFDTRDTVFYVLPEDTQSGSVVNEIDFTLRTSEHSTGIQDMLNALSSKCGFGQNHYKFDGASVATATQVICENSDMFRTLKKHETVLESVLLELCSILLRMCNDYLGMGLNEDVKMSVDFDDSIIEDKQAEFSRDMQLLSAGVMNSYEIRMKYLNEDEATAKAALPGMEDLVSGV